MECKKKSFRKFIYTMKYAKLENDDVLYIAGYQFDATTLRDYSETVQKAYQR
jgi:hypothetical protein